MQIRLYNFLPKTAVEGPGIRACVWVQGCPIRCRGCATPEAWDESGGIEVDVDALAQEIVSVPDLEGVTFAGGEPFAQAAALAELGRIVRESGLTVLTFTGYRLEDIKMSNCPSWQELLAVTDILIDGPYKREFADTSRPWIGSANQRYHFLTERYQYLQKDLLTISNKIEIRIRPNGQILVNGILSQDDLSFLLELRNAHEGRRKRDT
jgi:anaerobic ribonucleoside-triphosphate reductase activating protein